MSYIAYYTAPFEDHILRKSISYCCLPDIFRIAIMTPDTKLEKDTLYLGTPDTLAFLPDLAEEEFPVTLFTAGDSARLTSWLKQENLNLITTDLSIETLYEHLSRQLANSCRWNAVLSQALCQNQDLKQLLKTAGSQLNGHLLLLDSGFSVIESFFLSTLQERFGSEAVKQGHICCSDVRFLQQLLKRQGSPERVIPFTPEDSPNRCYLLPLDFPDTADIYLLFITQVQQPDPIITDMLSHLGQVICRLHKAIPVAAPSDNNILTGLFDDFACHSNLNAISPMEAQRRIPWNIGSVTFQKFAILMKPLLHNLFNHIKGP